MTSKGSGAFPLPIQIFAVVFCALPFVLCFALLAIVAHAEERGVITIAHYEPRPYIKRMAERMR